MPHPHPSAAVFVVSIPFILCLLYPLSAHAERFNNENWDTLPHPEVSSFTVHEDGGASGVTVDGRTFVQYNVPNEYGIRVQRFEIEDHYHYIVDGVIVNTTEELSVILAGHSSV